MKKILKYLAVIFALFFANPTSAIEPNSEFSRTSISVGVVVEDLNKSIDFYTKVVGMVVIRDLFIDSAKAKRMGLTKGETLSIKVLKLENVENATEIKLLSYGKKTKLSKQTSVSDANGIRYLTIFVKSLKPLLDRIAKNGIKTLGETPTMLDAKRQFVLIQDPDGNFVEFISAE